MRRAFVASTLLAALLVVDSVGHAQDSGASTIEVLSSRLAALATDWRQLTSRNDWFRMNDAEAAAATRQIEGELRELRARFTPRSLDADGIVLLRCYERVATIQMGEIKWRAQSARLMADLTIGLLADQQSTQNVAAPSRVPPDYYAHLVASTTTADLTADQVRALGERELARVDDDIRAVMNTVGFSGTMKRFFDFLRTDDRFFYPDTAEGREAYLSDTRRILAEMQARVAEIIVDPPNAPLEVRRLDGTSESLMLPMYQPDGVFLMPLADMRAAPKYFQQVIAYHEGVPGHHFQFSIQRARPGGGRSSPASDNCQSLGYAEGWGFYAERLPYELGLYTDAYANAGRLGLEAWRAARAIVDVRVNVEGWSDEQALAFLLDNTPLPDAMARIEVRRFRAVPAYATAYLVGKLAFQRQRDRAEAALGSKFDLRVFHDRLLRHGPMPLSAIEDLTGRWIESATR